MIKDHNDPGVVENGKKRAAWFKEHPESTWKNNLTPSRQKELGKRMRINKTKE